MRLQHRLDSTSSQIGPSNLAHALHGIFSQTIWYLGHMSSSQRAFSALCLTLIVIFSPAPVIPAAPPLAASSAGSRAQQLIRLLHLKALPKESGYLGVIGVSTQKVQVNNRSLAVQSQNYYMLTADRPINYLHHLDSDDTHILIQGGPVDYYIFHPDGRSELVVLGMDIAHGQRPVIAVPGGCWKALRLHKGATYALMANTLSPEFTPDRVRIGAGQAWIDRFTGSSRWATASTLRGFIGPNWIP